MMPGPTLVHIPLESRDHFSPLKKLNTAVSIESPDLFRIRGVPCIDRGPDRMRPPAVYEHWKNDVGPSPEDIARAATNAAAKLATKAANFARPTSVSAETPNFMKVPGVAINNSSAITGVEAACSPPPDYQPFRLPGVYMHGREAKAAVDRVVLPGQWRETDREAGQWGHATREFQEALVKMRPKDAELGGQKAALNPGPRSRELDSSSGSAAHSKSVAKGPSIFIPQSGSQQKHQRHVRSTDQSVGTPTMHRGKVVIEDTKVPTPSPVHRKPRPRESAKNKRTDNYSRKEKLIASQHGGSREGTGTRGKGIRGDEDHGRRRLSVVEVFMSRLEGRRGPQNRRESVDIFNRVLQDCKTNNTAQLRDDAVAVVSNGEVATENSAVAVERRVTKACTLRNVLARRKEAQNALSELMDTAKGSYMLSLDKDASKISLGRERT